VAYFTRLVVVGIDLAMQIAVAGGFRIIRVNARRGTGLDDDLVYTNGGRPVDVAAVGRKVGRDRDVVVTERAITWGVILDP
jgi:hypothetical protein